MKPRFGSNPQGPLKSSSVAGQTTPSVLALLLHPGIGIKRWAFVVVSGALLIILGVAFLLTIPLSSSFLTAARLVTLSGVSAAVRGLVFLTVGLLLLVIGARHIFGMFQEGGSGGKTDQVFTPRFAPVSNSHAGTPRSLLLAVVPDLPLFCAA